MGRALADTVRPVRNPQNGWLSPTAFAQLLCMMSIRHIYIYIPYNDDRTNLVTIISTSDTNGCLVCSAADTLHATTPCDFANITLKELAANLQYKFVTGCVAMAAAMHVCTRICTGCLRPRPAMTNPAEIDVKWWCSAVMDLSMMPRPRGIALAVA